MSITKMFLILALLSITNLTYTQETPENIRYNNEKQSVKVNGIKSLFIPGWGNPERKMLYRGIEIGGLIGTAISCNWLLNNSCITNEGLIYLGVFILSTGTLGANHLIAPIDAMFTTSKQNKELKQKYKLSLSPTYNPKNNGVGIGFAVDF